MSFSVTPKAGPASETQSTASSGGSKQHTQRAIDAMNRSIASQRGIPATPTQEPKQSLQAAPEASEEAVEEPKESLADAMGIEVQKSVEEESETQVESQASEETKPAEATSESKDPLSQQYAAMARKERALRDKVKAQEQAFITREAQLKAREEALSAKDSEYKSGYVSKADLKKNFMKHMSEAGVTYDEITEQMLTQQSVPPQVLSQLERLEARLEAAEKARVEAEQSSKKTYEEQVSAQMEQALKIIKKDTESLVKDNPEYEMISSTDSIQDVVDLIKATFDDTGEVLSVDEAARQVEEYLEKETIRLANSKKIRSKLQPAQSKTEEGKVEVKFQANAKQPQRTLTNAIGVQKPLSARERAILAMNANKKS